MRRKRRMEITVETSLSIIRRGTNQVPTWCPECSSPVQLITLEEAAVLAGVGESAIHNLVEQGQLHFVTTGAGILLICPNSLTVSISESISEAEKSAASDHPASACTGVQVTGDSG